MFVTTVREFVRSGMAERARSLNFPRESRANDLVTSFPACAHRRMTGTKISGLPPNFPRAMAAFRRTQLALSFSLASRLEQAKVAFVPFSPSVKAASARAMELVWESAATKAGIAGLPVLPRTMQAFPCVTSSLSASMVMNCGMAVSATSGYSLKTQNAREGRLGRDVASSLKRMNSLIAGFARREPRDHIEQKAGDDDKQREPEQAGWSFRFTHSCQAQHATS